MTGVLVGLALAAVPVFVVVPALLWLDRFEAEPTGLLLFAFGWGAAVATLIAILVNSTSIALLKASGGDVTAGVLVVRRSSRRPARAAPSCWSSSTGGASSTAWSTASSTRGWRASVSPSRNHAK